MPAFNATFTSSYLHESVLSKKSDSRQHALLYPIGAVSLSLKGHGYSVRLLVDHLLNGTSASRGPAMARHVQYLNKDFAQNSVTDKDYLPQAF